jgi:hypothetical protein
MGFEVVAIADKLGEQIEGAPFKVVTDRVRANKVVVRCLGRHPFHMWGSAGTTH